MRTLLALSSASLLSASLLLLPACSGDDTESGSGASSGTDTSLCAGVDSVGPRGSDQCPATDSVTDSNSDSNSGSATDGNTDGTVTDTTPTSGTGNTTQTTDTATDGTTGMTGMTDSDTATTGMTTDTATTGGLKCDSGCDFDGDFMVTLDMCSHEQYIGMPDPVMMRVTTNGTSITLEILGTPGLEPIMGTIDANGMFTAKGTATVAGYPNTSVEWTGTLVGTTFSATVSFGVDGDLPGECPMLASIQGDTC